MRQECLDWMLIWSRCHLERVLDEYVRHYNDERPHRSLELLPPRAINEGSGARVASATATAVRRRDRLGGLVHEYYEPQHDVQASEPYGCASPTHPAGCRLAFSLLAARWYV